MRRKMIRKGLYFAVYTMTCLLWASSASAQTMEPPCVATQDFQNFTPTGPGFGSGTVVSPGGGSMNPNFTFWVNDGVSSEDYYFDEVDPGILVDDTFLFSWGYTTIDFPAGFTSFYPYPGAPPYGQIRVTMTHFGPANGSFKATFYDISGNVVAAQWTHQPMVEILPRTNPRTFRVPNAGEVYDYTLGMPPTARRVVLEMTSGEVGLLKICTL
jgi:hypothetical protein